MRVIWISRLKTGPIVGHLFSRPSCPSGKDSFAHLALQPSLDDVRRRREICGGHTCDTRCGESLDERELLAILPLPEDILLEMRVSCKVDCAERYVSQQTVGICASGVVVTIGIEH